MIDIKKYELSTTGICAPVVVATWGGIKGDIENQQDLVDYVAAHGGGGAEWGSITGILSDQTDLMSYMSSFATMSWVEAQGYLTEHQSLEGYATESWVNSQGYLVQSDLSQYATRQWVTGRGYITSEALTGYATESWVSDSYATFDDLSDTVDKISETIIPEALEGYATESWVTSQGYASGSDLTSLTARVSALETNYGDAITITNNILG